MAHAHLTDRTIRHLSTSRVQEDFWEGQTIGISGTPGSILLDNESGRVRVVSGAVPLARLRVEIDRLISDSE